MGRARKVLCRVIITVLTLNLGTSDKQVTPGQVLASKYHFQRMQKLKHWTELSWEVQFYWCQNHT